MDGGDNYIINFFFHKYPFKYFKFSIFIIMFILNFPRLKKKIVNESHD